MRSLRSVDSYISLGYAVGDPILSKAEIQELRTSLDSEFSIKSCPSLISLCDNGSELHKKIIKLVIDNSQIKDFIAGLENAVGETISVIPGFEVTRNYLPHPWLLNGWHSDNGGELGNVFCAEKLRSKSYVFGKIGIYLQDNGDYGGAIDVIPRSHIYIRMYSKFRRRLATLRVALYSKIHSLNSYIFKYIPKNLLHKFIGAKSLFPPPGSPVFFDSGLLHSGTSPSKINAKKLIFEGDLQVHDMPKNKTKYVIYFQFGSKCGIESYLFDRLSRSTGMAERAMWKRQLELLSTLDHPAGLKAISLCKAALG